MSIIESLLILQEKDNKILQFEREIEDIPKRKQFEKERLEKHRSSVEHSKHLLKKGQSTIKELELEIDTRNGQITRLRQQQMELKTNQEFKAMESEINAVNENINSIEEKQLIMMDEDEGAQSELEAQRNELLVEENNVKRDCDEWDERASILKNDLKSTLMERNEALRKVSNEEFLDRYEQVHSRRENALVEINNGICGGCHMLLPPYVIHEIKKQIHNEGSIVSCDYCGRLLYLS